MSGWVAHEVQHLDLAMHVQGAGRFIHQEDFRCAHQEADKSYRFTDEAWARLMHQLAD